MAVERPAGPPLSGADFVAATLPGVSRTFALTIRCLPPGLRHSVSVAYLLCRAADTLEDSALVPDAARASLLLELARRVQGDGGALPGLALEAGAAADTDLLLHLPLVLEEFRRLPATQQAIIGRWVTDMCQGMASFPDSDFVERVDGVRLVAGVNGLERYCHYVAGTVGQMLTELFLEARPAASDAEVGDLRSRAESLALGLQLTNILKDVPDDYRRGWCYLPRELWNGGAPGDEPGRLLASRAAAAAMRGVALRALSHLERGFSYVERLGWASLRVRLFCALPLVLALLTLSRSDLTPFLRNPMARLRISRPLVYLGVAVSVVFSLFPAIGRGWVRRRVAATSQIILAP